MSHCKQFSYHESLAHDGYITAYMQLIGLHFVIYIVLLLFAQLLLLT